MQSDCPPEYYILTGCTTVTDCSGGSAGGSEGASRGGDEIAIGRAGDGKCGTRSISDRAGEAVFLVRTSGTWGEQVFTGEHLFSVLVTRLVSGCAGWPVSGDTDW